MCTQTANSKKFTQTHKLNSHITGERALKIREKKKLKKDVDEEREEEEKIRNQLERYEMKCVLAEVKFITDRKT